MHVCCRRSFVVRQAISSTGPAQVRPQLEGVRVTIEFELYQSFIFQNS